MSHANAVLPDALKVLFDPYEWTCFAEDPKETRVRPVHDFDSFDFLFFSINPLLNKDLNPTESWHNENTPRRCDANVEKFRNILIEMDKMSLDDQAKYMETLGLPFSTCIYSGNKSYHWIISLEESLPDRRSYDQLVKRIYRVVGFDKLDRTCKNPSRFSRFPDAYRPDTQKQQITKTIKGRINNNYLNTWLAANEAPEKVSEWETIQRRALRPKDPSSLYPATRNFLMFGVQENWNITLFSSACDMARNGWTLEEAKEEFLTITGTLDANDEKTIKSAYKTVENEG